MDEIHQYFAWQKATYNPIVFQNPFPPQQQQMVVTNRAPLQGGMVATPPGGPS